MTLTQIKKCLLRELDTTFSDHGFARITDKVHGHRYERRFDQGTQRINISLLSRPEGIAVEVPSVSIRFDDVEDTVARLEDPHPLVTPTDIAARPTLSFSLESGLLAPFTRKQWTIRQERDASAAAAEIAKFALGQGRSPFDRFSAMENALGALKNDDDRAKSLAAPDEARAKKATVLASLLAGRDGAKQIVQEKLRVLSGTARESFRVWSDRFLGTFAE